MTATIGAGTPADHAAVRDLLATAHLTLDGLAQALDHLVVARAGGEVVGCAALELYGEDALLRSVAVAPSRRGEHLGHALTEAALDLARARGVRRVYLLTETAEGFFPRFGFEVIGRQAVPPGVQTSVEFRSACPASAAAMRLELVR